MINRTENFIPQLNTNSILNFIHKTAAVFALILTVSAASVFAQISFEAGQDLHSSAALSENPTPAEGPVTGQIRQAGGGVLAGAIVKAINPETGQATVGTTNRAGVFRFENLTPGTDYVLTPEAEGYRFEPASQIVGLTSLIEMPPFTAIRLSSVPNDFDGDGASDIAVFRQGSGTENSRRDKGTWYYMQSRDNTLAAVEWGWASDKPVPADYDGDNRTDIAVYRDGMWYILQSSNGQALVERFGLASDTPAPADYDGDGRADIAIFNDGNWFIKQSAADTELAVRFGLASDHIVPADFDGDFKADVAVFRAGVWHILHSSTGEFQTVSWGQAGDRPAAADFTGEGKSDMAVYRPSNGTWYVLKENGQFDTIAFGRAGDKPVIGDYNGDGKTEPTVVREGIWHLLESGVYRTIQFGLPSDIVIGE